MADSRTYPGLLPTGWADMPFEFFREGVEICRLWQGGPDVALLRYAKGASVPRHRHTGHRTQKRTDGPRRQPTANEV